MTTCTVTPEFRGRSFEASLDKAVSTIRAAGAEVDVDLYILVNNGLKTSAEHVETGIWDDGGISFSLVVDQSLRQSLFVAISGAKARKWTRGKFARVHRASGVSDARAYRTFVSAAPQKGRAQTMTHDCKRHGTTTLFAAPDVKSGMVIGDCSPARAFRCRLGL